MNLALRKSMTLAEFLEWEERQPLRYEFDGVGPVAMVGGTAGHADIQANLAAALRTRLRGKPCRFYGSDLKFQVADGQVRYPHGMVVWSPLARTALPRDRRHRGRPSRPLTLSRRGADATLSRPSPIRDKQRLP